MGKSPYVRDLLAAANNQSVTADHFGANLVCSTNTVRADGPFPEIVDSLGISSLRYPGGSVTEQYFDPLSSTWDRLFGVDHQDYAVAPDGKTITGPTAFFDYAASNGLGVDFVLPTASLLTTGARDQAIVDQAALAKVQSAVAGMLRGEYGEVDLRTLEIGNEYYYAADLTASEYGLVANELVVALGREFRAYAESTDAPANWAPPRIAVQAGAAWQSGDNEAIIAALSMEARSLINEVVVHYYPTDLADVDVKDRNLDQINAWDSASGFGQLDLNVSEWNVQATENGDTGLAQSSTLIAAFDEMLVEGVDAAAVWGVQFRWLDTGLSTVSGHDAIAADPASLETRLTVSGEIIASLIESTPGLKPFDPNLPRLITTERSMSHGADDLNANIVVNAFGNDDRVVLFISSRHDRPIELSLNLEDYFGETEHVWGEVLSSVDDPSTPGRDESDPLSYGALPRFETLTGVQLGEGSGLTLGPYSILRVSVQLDGSGVTMQGHDPLTDDTLDYDDVFVGSRGDDKIKGFAGDDTLQGMTGNDVVHGGGGSDRLEGGGGDDLLRGGDGNDSVDSNWGNDILSGGGGQDTLQGGDGKDVLTGGNGNDFLFGGQGDDVLLTGTGNNQAVGGQGADYFVVSPDGDTLIKDWGFEGGDRVTFLGQFESMEHLADSSRDTVGTEDAPGDLIITNDAGYEVIFEGAAGRFEELKPQIVDFQAEGEAALGLCDRFNDMSGPEIGDYLDSLSSEEFNAQVLGADPVILMSNLDAESVAHFFNGLESDEIDLFLGDMGRESVGVFFEDLEIEEIDNFVSTIESNALLEIIDVYGAGETLAQVEDCGPETRATFFEKLENTKYADLDPFSHGNDGDIPDDDLPWLPPHDPDAQPVDEDEEGESDYAANMDCFVATVVYADGNHPDVWLLRWYRDRVMRNTRFGRLLIAAYWQFGPQLARRLHTKPRLCRLFHFAIRQVVSLICWLHDRTPGRQADQPVCEDSRLILLSRYRKIELIQYGRGT